MSLTDSGSQSVPYDSAGPTAPIAPVVARPPLKHSREHRRRRMRRHGRRAYIRSVYFLPSLATLGNAVCGFGAMYVATLDRDVAGRDQWTNFFSDHRFIVAAYL